MKWGRGSRPELYRNYSMVPDKNRTVFIMTSGGIPAEFISVDHIFHFNPPVVFIQTAVFQNVTSRVLL